MYKLLDLPKSEWPKRLTQKQKYNIDRQFHFIFEKLFTENKKKKNIAINVLQESYNEKTSTESFSTTNRVCIKFVRDRLDSNKEKKEVCEYIDILIRYEILRYMGLQDNKENYYIGISMEKKPYKLQKIITDFKEYAGKHMLLVFKNPISVYNYFDRIYTPQMDTHISYMFVVLECTLSKEMIACSPYKSMKWCNMNKLKPLHIEKVILFINNKYPTQIFFHPQYDLIKPT